MATSLTAVIRKRVHEDGIATSGEQIGTYSKEYMVVRTGGYKNAARVTRGKNKGKLKDSGTFTKRKITFGDSINSEGGNVFGKSVFNNRNDGVARPRYNRTADTKVVGSLTRQMENDLGVNASDPIKTERGYAIGFKNPFNYDKSQWLEISQRKRIWGLTAGEEAIVQQIADKFTEDAITGKNS